MVKEFEGPEQDQIFKDWMARHPNGFYLNKTSANGVMLHRVGCIHLDDGEGYIATSQAKVVSEDRRALEVWAAESGKKRLDCKSCKP